MALPILTPVTDIDAESRANGRWDAVVVVGPGDQLGFSPATSAAIDAARAIDRQLDEAVAVLPVDDLAGGRLVLSPTGPLSRDYDDVRRFGDAARKGIVRARDAGARKPLLVVVGIPDQAEFAHAPEVSLLEAAGGLWEPFEARQARGETELEPVKAIGFAVPSGGDGDRLVEWVTAVEAGRRLARDLGGTDPEHMRPEAFAAMCRDQFADTTVGVEVVDDPDELVREYPLLSAVARASTAVHRHRPHVVRLSYRGEGEPAGTLLFAGKGVTYDTGGADLKVGGSMAGMSRDKGGAAAVAGLFETIRRLAPKGLHVVAELGVVRNSIGADAYVTDEILVSHAGVRVRVGNTDAEGRLVLADLLSHLRQQATDVRDARVFSVATLTGHASRAIGPYASANENGPARSAGIAQSLARAGDLWADPFEISRLRREDFDFIKPRSKADDVMSCNNAPSSITERGHQFPMAFLAIASGLANHGGDGDPPLAYTHLDIAGSSTEGGDWQHGRPTGSPIATLAATFLR